MADGYLLESSSVDRLLLEDGSGVYALDAPAVASTLVQQAGDFITGGATAITLTFPAPATAGNLMVFAMAGDKDTGAMTAPAGWNIEHQVTSASVSLYFAWKPATGGETSLTFGWTTASSTTSGNTAWIGEYSQPGSGPWAMQGKASNVTDEVAVTTKATGTTPATGRDGVGFAIAAVDTQTEVGSPVSFTNGYDLVYRAPQATGGHGAIFVGANLAVPSGTAATSTFNWTIASGRSADQTSAAIIVLGRNAVGANTAPTVDTGADASTTTGTTFSRTAVATDAEGAVTHAWTASPATLTLGGASTATVSVTPATAGTWTLTDTVTDAGGLTGSDSFVLTVTAAAPAGTASLRWASGTAFSSSGGTATANPVLTKTGPVSVGDYLVASFSTNGGVVTRTSGSTWTKHNEVTLTNPKGYLWGRYATQADVDLAVGSDFDGVWTISGTVASSSAGISVYSNVDPNNPLSGTPATAQNATSTTVDFPVVLATADNNALLVGVWVANTGELAHTIPTGFTEQYTLGSRHNTLVTMVSPTAGTATYTYTLSSGRAGGGMMLALKGGTGTNAPPTPTVDYRMVGADGRVKFKTNNATSVRIKYGTDTAVTQNVVFTAPATPNSLGVAEILMPENAATDLYYRIAMTDSAGTEILDAKAVVGRVPRLTESFGASWSSCCDAADSGALPNVRARNDPFFFHRGDMWYDDTGSQTVASFRSHMLAKLMATNHEPLFATTRVLYSPSDHDISMRNNGTSATEPAAIAVFNQVYREFIPTPTLPSATEHYYSYRVPGTNVLLVNLDARTSMTAIGAAESSNKRVLGATQETWLTNLIDSTDAKEIWLLGDTPWVGTANPADDAWLGYDTQRQRLASYFLTKQPAKQFRYFGGDMHAVAVGIGPGNVTNYQGSPLNNSASLKANGWAQGPYPASGSTVVEQYARVVLTVTGTDYTIVYNGYSGDNTLRVGPHTTSVTGTVVRSGWYALINGVEVPATLRST